jgi:acetolactate synthase small subunit
MNSDQKIAGSDEELIVFVIEAADRPGIMHAIAAVFSHRGLSMHSLVADTGRKPPRILVSFLGPERQRRLVEQVLQRLHYVQSVRVLRSDSPELRAIATARVLDTLPDMADVLVQRHGDIVVITGTYAAVDAVVTRLQHEQRIESVARSLVAL